MSQILNRAKQVLQIEADSILHLIPKLDSQFEKAVEMVLKCSGKLVITGIGKSGQIARKLSMIADIGLSSIIRRYFSGMLDIG